MQESVAFLDCTLEDTIDTGDHTLFVGKIIEAEVLNDLEPMTCHDYGKVYIGQS